MKIAFILDQPWDSALTDYAFKIYRLASREHITKVFCLEDSFISRKVDGASFIKALRNKNPLKTLAAFFHLYKKLKEFEPNIVVTIWGDATFLSCLLKKNLNFKLIRIFGVQGRLKTPKGCIDRIILPCQYLRDYIHADFKDIIVLRSFVDIEKFRFSKEGRKRIRKVFGLSGKIVFGAVGRLDKVKGYKLLIEAFAKANIENSVLFIVGEEKGIKKAELVEITHKFNLSNVIILTNRRNDITDIMSAFDIGVISSINSEVIPRVLFEFLSVGLTVVSTDIGCLKEIAKENGLIAIKPSAKELAPALFETAKNLKNLDRIEFSEKALKYKLYLPPNLFNI